MTMTQTDLTSLGAAPSVQRQSSLMPLGAAHSVHRQSSLQLEDLDSDLAFPMTVGAGFVDPRLVSPIADDPDIEDLIAFRTSTI